MPTNNHSDNLFDEEPPLEDEQLWDLLSLYVDGEADPAQAAIVEQMLSSDPAYRRDFDFLMASAQTMHAIEEIEPPIGLRDAVLAKTTRRPTLVGRLRAAWNRATTPAFGRYATIGGAFAAAALAVVLFWPHTNAVHPAGTASQSVAVMPGQNTNVATATPSSPTIGDIDLSGIEHSVTLPTKPSNHDRVAAITIPPIRPSTTLDTHNPKEKSGPQMAQIKRPMPSKTNVARLDGSNTQQVPYSYNRQMDVNSAPHNTETISAPATDFGTKVDATAVAANDASENPPVPKPGDTKVQDPTTAATPKPHIRTAALPPDVSQNIASAVIRHNQAAQYSNYEHNATENINRREVVVDVIKGSF